MRQWVMILAAATATTACSQEEPRKQESAAPAPAKPAPGAYQGTARVVSIASTDKTKPATSLAEGASAPAAGCVGADGTIDPTLFAEGGDQCTVESSYVSNGRISLQLDCRREGQSGQVMQSVNGSYTADSMTADVSTTTYLSGTGDYSMTRQFTLKRAGECAAAPATEGQNTAG